MKALDKIKLMTGITAAMMTQDNSSYTSPSLRDTNKPATMTRKEWKKRKRRLELTKFSRRVNR